MGLVGVNPSHESLMGFSSILRNFHHDRAQQCNRNPLQEILDPPLVCSIELNLPQKACTRSSGGLLPVMLVI